MSSITIKGYEFVPYIVREEIAESIANLADRINEDYKNSENLIIVGILNGAFMFTSDLCKKLNNVKRVDFMRISSYEGLTSTKNVQIKLDLDYDISGKDIIIVEDIVDTGLTMDALCKMLYTRNPKSINICTMLFKFKPFEENSENHTNYPNTNSEESQLVKYVGRRIDNYFVIGYGMDLDGEGRDLDEIYKIKE